MLWSACSRLLLSRIGFLGLGLMGSGIVSNLLKMGHIVTVWNRTAEKVYALQPVAAVSNTTTFSSVKAPNVDMVG